MKVLVAEDDLAQQRLLGHLLRTWGYEPVVVGDGVEAIRALQAPDVTIALIDWEIPGANGPQVCEALRRTGRYVHAIILTARNSSEDVPIALGAGASDYLGKPITRTDLQARIRVAQRMVDLHAAVAQMQKLESIGQLAAGIAHEINTPAQFVNDNLRFATDSVAELTPVLGCLTDALRALDESGAAPAIVDKAKQAIEAAELDFLLEELPACLSQSLEGITRIAEIVRAMKSFSHPGGQGRKSIDLNEAVRSTVTVSRSEWKHVARIETDLHADLPHLLCHPGELNQAILNLIVNAAHAVESAHAGSAVEGVIRVVTRSLEDAVLLSIEDNGAGIAAEDQHRIFDPFFTTKEVGKGTGQGLAVTHDVITNKHGGRIWFETRPGQGTTFHVELPLGGEEDE